MLYNLQNIVKNITWYKIIQYFFSGLLIVALIIGIIYNPVDTLINLGIFVAIMACIGLTYYLHSFFQGKSKIDWYSNPEIKEFSDLFCISNCLFIYLIISDVINGFFDNLTIAYILFLIFSVWTYRSIIMAKDNALLLMRTYLIFSLYALGYYLIGNISDPLKVTEPFEWIINFKIVEIIFTIGMYIILPSAIIKGIIIAYSKKCKEVYLNQKYRYVDILFITILVMGIIYFYNNTFTLI